MMDFESFLRVHKSQLESSQIPTIFWRTIFTKVTNEIFNTGDYFSIEKIEYEDNDEETDDKEDSITNGNLQSNPTWQSNDKFYENCEYRVVLECDRMEPDCGENIFLIDHMWTFELAKRKATLVDNEHLVERLCALMDIKCDSLKLEQKIDLIEHNIFKYCQSYTLNDGHNNMCTYWYIMDEFGSKIGNSLQPSFRCIPFTYLPEGVAYNLLYPVELANKGDLVTRNYIESSARTDDSENMTLALMLPWQYSDLSSVSFEQIEIESSFAFKYSPDQIMPDTTASRCGIPSDRPLKVYSQYKYVNEYLTDARFQLCDNRDEADILWLYEPFRQYKQLSRDRPDTFINQFPFENIVTVKDLFAIVSRRAQTSNNLNDFDDFSPAWLMPTYDLQGELVKFVSYYQNRDRQALDNHWIVKPWNLSRGLETQVSNNLSEIVKLRNALPKVVSKYIERPVLFRRDDICANVKFDLRFIVLLKSIRPLELLVFKKFWIRFANTEFSLDELDNYQKHFTVMNYVDGDNVSLRQMDCSEFVVQFDSQYGKNQWSHLKQDIYGALKQVFTCASLKDPPSGIGSCPQSRAVYGIDILPRWRKDSLSSESVMQPTILEVNWMPDCKRACEYYPSFYNDIFNALFLGKLSDNIELL